MFSAACVTAESSLVWEASVMLAASAEARKKCLLMRHTGLWRILTTVLYPVGEVGKLARPTAGTPLFLPSPHRTEAVEGSRQSHQTSHGQSCRGVQVASSVLSVPLSHTGPLCLSFHVLTQATCGRICWTH